MFATQHVMGPMRCDSHCMRISIVVQKRHFFDSCDSNKNFNEAWNATSMLNEVYIWRTMSLLLMVILLGFFSFNVTYDIHWANSYSLNVFQYKQIFRKITFLCRVTVLSSINAGFLPNLFSELVWNFNILIMLLFYLLVIWNINFDPQVRWFVLFGTGLCQWWFNVSFG